MAYCLYGNTFYKPVVTNGKESYVVITKPAGVVAVKALPEWGAGAGAVVGVAAAKSSPGNQAAVAVGTAREFRLARSLSVDVVV